ncbi:hypothetical protein OZX61_07260 [Acinetobacter sp. ESL0695]|uniref:hypothetical protein n=1 Tax=Acinetobacter sp. ESL0695 TaxID=2983215 RepID=UPI0023F0FAD3|nr:hypothetical protein [Acinetobacter sp. ESL0695]WEV48087.1 hypothetical protein OZX61_07260 [Acinetobacter sp. ESL0695]
MKNWQKKEFNRYLDVPFLDKFTFDAEDGLFFECYFDESKKIVSFDSYLVLRTINESDAFKILDEQNFDGTAWFFTSEDSELIDWFNGQSSDIHKGKYQHCIILTQEKVIEILSQQAPQITIVE